MSISGPRPSLRQRVAAAIVEAAASVLAERGDAASMSDVATAAGVARATLYRYFPSRDALLEALGNVAVQETGDRLAAARLGEVPVDEGFTRAIRALVEVGDYFVVLARERARVNTVEFDRRVGEVLIGFLERGRSVREVRADLPASLLMEALIAVTVSVLTARAPTGIEDKVAAITKLFLDGARGSAE